jgi:hypothetical protein
MRKTDRSDAAAEAVPWQGAEAVAHASALTGIPVAADNGQRRWKSRKNSSHLPRITVLCLSNWLRVEVEYSNH